jgi:hypothetical protein
MTTYNLVVSTNAERLSGTQVLTRIFLPREVFHKSKIQDVNISICVCAWLSVLFQNVMFCCMTILYKFILQGHTAV